MNKLIMRPVGDIVGVGVVEGAVRSSDVGG